MFRALFDMKGPPRTGTLTWRPPVAEGPPDSGLQLVVHFVLTLLTQEPWAQTEPQASELVLSEQLEGRMGEAGYEERPMFGHLVQIRLWTLLGGGREGGTPDVRPSGPDKTLDPVRRGERGSNRMCG